MSARKLLRAVYTVQFDRRLDAWAIFAGSVPVAAYRTRGDAVEYGAVLATLSYLSHRLDGGKAATHTLCSQLRVRNRKGAWGKERTYGFDPKRRKG